MQAGCFLAQLPVTVRQIRLQLPKLDVVLVSIVEAARLPYHLPPLDGVLWRLHHYKLHTELPKLR